MKHFGREVSKPYSRRSSTHAHAHPKPIRPILHLFPRRDAGHGRAQRAGAGAQAAGEGGAAEAAVCGGARPPRWVGSSHCVIMPVQFGLFFWVSKWGNRADLNILLLYHATLSEHHNHPPHCSK